MSSKLRNILHNNLTKSKNANKFVWILVKNLLFYRLLESYYNFQSFYNLKVDM